MKTDLGRNQRMAYLLKQVTQAVHTSCLAVAYYCFCLELSYLSTFKSKVYYYKWYMYFILEIEWDKTGFMFE